MSFNAATFDLFGFPIPIWVFAPVFFMTWVTFGWMLKRGLFAWLEALTRKTQTNIDDILIRSANIPVNFMIVVSGFTVLFHLVAPSSMGDWGKYVVLASKIATFLAVILFVDQLLANFLQVYSLRIELLRVSQSFTTVIAHMLIFGIGTLVILDSVGISVTPILASLGVGSLAVALALQPTLENVFSGLQILMDQPIRPGHFIRLESGEEGYVEKIGWRSTWIRQLANNMVIIPNKQLINARVINYYYPSKDLAVLVEVGVHYSSDLDQVERVTSEVAKEVLKRVTGGVADFDPFIRYHTYSGSSINFSVILRGQEFVDQYLIKHEFIKALSKRYAQEKIVIPYPITAINLAQEKAVFPSPVSAS